jgi:outer membrane protein, heavy metal efflux system
MMRAMRFRLHYLGIIFGALLGQPAWAQTAPVAVPSPTSAAALSLAEATQRFRTENLRLLAAKHEVSAARADIIAAGLLPNPRLSVGAAFRVHGEPEGADRDYQVMLAQQLPLWGRLGAAKEAAELTATATEREFLAFTWQELAALRHAYLSLQVAGARQAVLSAGLEDLERVQRVLDARAAAGANPVYDRIRLDVERGNLRARIAQAASDVSQASAELNLAIGHSAPRELVASDALPEPAAVPPNAAGLVERALRRRHDVAASKLQVEAAYARARAARKRFIPEPELGIGYERWTNIAGLPPSAVGGAVLAQASIPLPLFDRGQGTVDRELRLGEAAKARAEGAVAGVRRDVLRALSRVQLTTAAYGAYRQGASQQAEQVRKIAEVTYREGRGTILELLDAYSSYLRAAEQSLELRAAALEAGIELEAALGPR